MKNEMNKMLDLYWESRLLTIPVVKNGKKPIGRWREHYPENLEKASYEDKNVGIRCGEKVQLIVIDVDGVDAWTELEKHGITYEDLKEFVHVSTGRKGGFHFYFKYVNGTKKIKTAFSVIPGVDIKGDGSYVVAPPSIHPNGTEYIWIVSPDEGIVNMPQKLFSLLILPTISTNELPDGEK